MAVTIGSNRLAGQALRYLAKSGDDVTRSFERLASGQRINRASDDAAGISIADKLRSDSKLQSQAIRNINDGISVVSIIDSAISSQVSIVQRMSELAEQAANGTYSSKQRDALSREFIELRKELARIAETTTFNGLNLLSTSNAISGDRIGLQAGINGSTNSQLQLPNIGTGGFTGSVDVSNMLDYVRGTEFIDLTSGNSYASLEALEERIRSNGAGGFGGAMQLFHIPTTLANGQTKDYYYLMTGFGAGTSRATGQVFERSATGELTEVASYVELDLNSTGDRVTSVYKNGDITIDLRGIEFKTGGQTYSTPESGGSDATTIDSVFIRDDTFTNLDAVGLETLGRAQIAVEVTSNRVKQLAALRGELGAVDSRLGSAVSILAVQRENFRAAEGRIRDVDVASESTALITRQISQQTALAILAQASRQPQLALQLLS